MPYSQEHKTQSRERILSAGIELFCRFGFDQVSLTQIMQQAKMTHGAFYAHFKSKSSLYAQSITHGAIHSLWNKHKNNITTISDFERIIGGYLSLQHVNQQQKPCPLAFLVTDVAHRNAEVRQSYEKSLQAMLKGMSKLLGALGLKNTSALAQQLITSMVGTVSIARTLTDESLQLSMLENTKRELIRKLMR